MSSLVRNLKLICLTNLLIAKYIVLTERMNRLSCLILKYFYFHENEVKIRSHILMLIHVLLRFWMGCKVPGNSYRVSYPLFVLRLSGGLYPVQLYQSSFCIDYTNIELR